MSTPMHDRFRPALHLPMERALPLSIIDTKAVQYILSVKRRVDGMWPQAYRHGVVGGFQLRRHTRRHGMLRRPGEGLGSGHGEIEAPARRPGGCRVSRVRTGGREAAMW